MPLHGTPPDSQRRSSPHRFGSIASFHVLKPFSRRRSNHGTDHSAATSSTSNLSLASTPTNSANLPLSSSSSLTFPSSDDAPPSVLIPPLPVHPSSSRLSSYIGVPNDPIGGMPRSRTLSNLPVPTRARRHTPIAAPQPHAHLSSIILPSTRLPSPSMSTRRHNHRRLTSTNVNTLAVRNRMTRSDTEPLLPLNVEHASNVGRATAFKENISLSPVKPRPPSAPFDTKDLYSSSLPSRTYASRNGWVPPSESCENLLPPDTLPTAFHCAQPLTPGESNSHVEEKQAYSSPAYHRAQERLSTLSTPQRVQRWNSQPILANITNRRLSRHGEIQERRLMSEVPPVLPSPSAPQLYLPKDSPTLRKVALVRQPPSPHSTPASPTDSRLIYGPQPIPYWCGRFSALNDSLRNVELRSYLQQPQHGLPTSKAESDRLNTPEASIRRMRRAMEELHALCATQEARDSFILFQLQFAAVNACTELGRPIPLKLPEREVEKVGVQEMETKAVEAEPCAIVEAAGVSEHKKASFVERLLGKHRRSLIL